MWTVRMCFHRNTKGLSDIRTTLIPVYTSILRHLQLNKSSNEDQKQAWILPLTSKVRCTFITYNNEPYATEIKEFLPLI